MKIGRNEGGCSWTSYRYFLVPFAMLRSELVHRVEKFRNNCLGALQSSSASPPAKPSSTAAAQHSTPSITAMASRLAKSALGQFNSILPIAIPIGSANASQAPPGYVPRLCLSATSLLLPPLSLRFSPATLQTFQRKTQRRRLNPSLTLSRVRQRVPSWPTSPPVPVCPSQPLATSFTLPMKNPSSPLRFLPSGGLPSSTVVPFTRSGPRAKTLGSRAS